MSENLSTVNNSDGHRNEEIELARKRLAASLRVLDAALKVDENLRKMMEFSTTNVATAQDDVERAEQALRVVERMSMVEENTTGNNSHRENNRMISAASDSGLDQNITNLSLE